MKVYIVMEDGGDGDVRLSYFQSQDEAETYMEKNEDWCYYESNPRCLDTDDISFTTVGDLE